MIIKKGFKYITPHGMIFDYVESLNSPLTVVHLTSTDFFTAWSRLDEYVLILHCQ